MANHVDMLSAAVYFESPPKKRLHLTVVIYRHKSAGEAFELNGIIEYLFKA